MINIIFGLFLAIGLYYIFINAKRPQPIIGPGGTQQHNFPQPVIGPGGTQHLIGPGGEQKQPILGPGGTQHLIGPNGTQHLL